MVKDCKYDQINIVETEDTVKNRAFYANVKYAACAREPLSTIFIDNDVIITKNDCINKVLNMQCDVVCQHSDIDYAGYNRSREFLLPIVLNAVKVDELMSVSNNGLNGGLLKFNNEELKQRYLSDRVLLINSIVQSDIYKRLINDPTFHWEMFVEKWYLRNLCITGKYQFSTLDKANGSHLIDKLGYYHLNGTYGTKTTNFNEMCESRTKLLSANPH